MALPTRPPKEMIFDWCKSGHHDKCRRQYGGDRIVCICKCEDHGVNYQPINKTMTEEEVKASIASLNSIMVGDAGDGVSENRAVKETSNIWGDQIKEGNKIGNSDWRKSDTPHYNAAKVSKYEYKVALDAENITELEARRNAVHSYGSGYEGFDAWL